MMALDRFDTELDKPITESLACKDLGNNQTARQGADALQVHVM